MAGGVVTSAGGREIAFYRRYISLSRRQKFSVKKKKKETFFFSQRNMPRGMAAKFTDEFRRSVAWTNNEIVIVFTRDRQSGKFYERTLNSWILARS